MKTYSQYEGAALGKRAAPGSGDITNARAVYVTRRRLATEKFRP
jgi:hypothetical protein